MSRAENLNAGVATQVEVELCRVCDADVHSSSCRYVTALTLLDTHTQHDSMVDASYQSNPHSCHQYDSVGLYEGNRLQEAPFCQSTVYFFFAARVLDCTVKSKYKYKIRMKYKI